jgi:hypothetical protein
MVRKRDDETKGRRDKTARGRREAGSERREKERALLSMMFVRV